MGASIGRNAVLGLGLVISTAAACAKEGKPEDSSSGSQPQPTLFGANPEYHSFPASMSGHDRLFGVKVDSHDNIFVVGSVADSTESGADFAMVVTKILPTGERDATFGTNGVARHNVVQGANGELARSTALLPGGKLLVVGIIEHAGAADARDRDVAVLRLDALGARDAAFGDNGVVVLDLSEGEVVGSGYVADVAWGVVTYDDGRILISGAQKRVDGTDSDFAIIRLNADGTRDTGFGTNGVATVDINHANASPRSTLIMPDRSILGSGYMTVEGVTTPVVFKMSDSGQLDPAFGNGGVFNQVVWATATEVYSIALQGSKIVTVGYGHEAESDDLDWVSLRLNPDGTLDSTWGVAGIARFDFAGFNDNARSLAVLEDGRVVLVGGARTGEANLDAAMAVLTPEGAPDLAFSPTGWRTLDLGGPADMMWSVAINAARTHAVLAGVKAMGANAAGNDDGALLSVPLREAGSNVAQ